MLPQFKMFVICGKAGSGKNYFLNKLKEACNPDEINVVVADTSRPPREGEIDGIDYNFLPPEESPLSIVCNKTYLETAIFNDWFYGTSLKALDKDKINILITSPTGISQLKTYPFVDLYCCYLAIDAETRIVNQLKRENNPDCNEICRRILTDHEDFIKLFALESDNFKIHTYRIIQPIQYFVEKAKNTIHTWYMQGKDN